VTAQLIAAGDGSHLWSDRYDRELADVFAIQDDIARAIARELRMKLSPAPARHQPPVAAYEALLRGRHYYQQWTPEAQKVGEACYREALALDPSYTQAYCELGLHHFSAVTENQISPADAARIMRSLASHSLSVDPTDSQAHVVLALVAVLDYDWALAAREFELALDAPYISPLSRQAYAGWYLVAIGDDAEAWRQLALALQEDPLNPLIRLLRAEMLLATGDAAGEQECLKQIELQPNFWIPMGWLSAYYAVQGRLTDARTYVERALRLVPGHLGMGGFLAGLLQKQGDADGAASLRAKVGPDDAIGVPNFHFCYHMVMGDSAAAARWLEASARQRDTRAPWILPNLFGPAFTASPYWPPLARTMGLPPGAWASSR
jgi:serine/threonine-protein kinase